MSIDAERSFHSITSAEEGSRDEDRFSNFTKAALKKLAFTLDAKKASKLLSELPAQYEGLTFN